MRLIGYCVALLFLVAVFVPIEDNLRRIINTIIVVSVITYYIMDALHWL